jgi:hypothetical protein
MFWAVLCLAQFTVYISRSEGAQFESGDADINIFSGKSGLDIITPVSGNQ